MSPAEAAVAGWTLLVILIAVVALAATRRG